MAKSPPQTAKSPPQTTGEVVPRAQRLWANAEALWRIVPGWLVQIPACVLIVLPFFLGLHFVHSYGVNVPWEDEWRFVTPLFEKWDAGTLSFWDFWAQHSEHRIVFAGMLEVGLGLISDWNLVLEMYVSQILLALMLGGFLYAFHRTCPAKTRLWLAVPIAFLVFSLRQYQPFIMGDGIPHIVVSGSIVGAYLCLNLANSAKRLGWKLSAAVLLATVATFSSGQGLLVWPAGLLPLVFSPLPKRRKTAIIAIWAALGTLEWIAYFWGYVKPADHPPLGFSCEYFAILGGGALFPYPVAVAAATAGAMILILAAVAVLLARQEGKLASYSFWIAILCYGILVQAQITVSRCGFATSQALSSRYAATSLLTVIGLYGILSALCTERIRPWVSAMWGGLLALVIVGVVMSTVDGHQAGAEHKAWREYNTFVFCTVNSQPDAAIPLKAMAFAEPDYMRQKIAYLENRRFNIFAPGGPSSRYLIPDANLPVLSLPAEATINQFSLDKRSGVVTAAGWAVDNTGQDLVGGVYLEVDGKLYPAYYGMKRDDVAEALKKKGSLATDRVRNCGFMRVFSLEQLGSNPHRLVMKVLTKDRSAFFKPNDPTDFNIGPPK